MKLPQMTPPMALAPSIEPMMNNNDLDREARIAQLQAQIQARMANRPHLTAAFEYVIYK